jgi:hypothetical protein
MKHQNLILLDEESNTIESYNYYDNQNQDLYLKNKIDFFLPLNVNHDICQKSDDNSILEEIKKIMDKPQLTKTELERNDEDMSELIYCIKNKETSKNSNKSTFNTTKNITSSILDGNTVNDIKNYFINKTINFKTKLHHKRGRKSIGKPRSKYFNKYHGSGDFDNVQRKIQVNYFNFLIRFSNDVIKSVLGKETPYFFKDIKYEYKKIVSHKYVEDLKKCKLSDIFQMKISTKNKNYEENLNKETFLEICRMSPVLKQFFENNYLYIFKKYYCGLQSNQDIIDFDGLKVELSPLTKGFLYLLRKNEIGKEKFSNVLNDVYFSGLNYKNETKKITSNPFIITNYKK